MPGRRFPLGAAATLVGLLALSLGLVLSRALLDRSPGLYLLELGEAQWIAPREDSAVACLRGELDLPPGARGGWVAVDAPGSQYALLVNGHAVYETESFLWSAASLHDLEGWVSPGRNVIALRVARAAEGTARARIEVGYADASGAVRRVGSGPAWSAWPLDARERGGRIAWSDPTFTGRSPARVLPPSPSATVPRLGIPAELYREPLCSLWLASPDGARAATFQQQIVLHARDRTVWIRVASAGPWTLFANGVRAAHGEGAVTGTALLDVSDSLRPGSNDIEVATTADGSPARLAMDAFASGRGGRFRNVPFEGASVEVGGQPRGAPALAAITPLPSALARATALPSRPEGPPAPTGRRLERALHVALLAAAALLLGLADWLLAARLLGALAPMPHDEALRKDAWLRLPVLVAVAAALLVRYDVRVAPDFPFRVSFVVLALALLGALRLLLVLELLIRRAPRQPRPSEAHARPPVVALSRPATAAVALALAVTSGALRLPGLGEPSLHHDEASVLSFARGIFERGYPTERSRLGKPLATYELLPYPVAASTALLGRGEAAVRLPAVLYAMATTALLFIAGRSLWGPAEGLLAALLHAFSPLALVWGRNAFHPQAAQLLALLTALLVYTAWEEEQRAARDRRLAAAALAFGATYLTWEGSGLLLPALAGTLLLVGWPRCRASLRTAALPLAAVVLLVTAQLARRVLVGYPYLVVGSGLSTRALELTFLSPSYRASAYVESFLWREHHVTLTLAVVAGLIPLARRDRAFRFTTVLLGLILLLLTNLLPRSSPRYAYFAQPLLLLAASAATVGLGRWLRPPQGARPGLVVGGSRWLAAIAAPLLLFFSSNSVLLELRRLGAGAATVSEMSPARRSLDYRSAALFVRSAWRPGDVVVSLMPHVFEHYAGFRSDYYLQSLTGVQVIYGGDEPVPVYTDKYIGTPVLRSLEELRDVLGGRRRAWIVASPYGLFRTTNDAPVLEFIDRHAKVAHESFGMRVYLWEG